MLFKAAWSKCFCLQDAVSSLERWGRPRCWTDEGRSLRSAEVWEDREEEVHLTELTSRYNPFRELVIVRVVTSCR